MAHVLANWYVFHRLCRDPQMPDADFFHDFSWGLGESVGEPKEFRYMRGEIFLIYVALIIRAGSIRYCPHVLHFRLENTIDGVPNHL